MKKTLFLIMAMLCSFVSLINAQGLTINTTTINSGGTVVLTGTNETNLVQWRGTQRQYINTVTPTSYYSNQSIQYTDAVFYNSTTQAPTSLQYKLINTSPVDVIVNFCVQITAYSYPAGTFLNPQTFCFNVTVHPGAPNTYYSAATGGTFYKNNCAANFYGSVQYYSVPANAYTSLISQADANAKASADVSANGQNYANSVGTCTAFTPCIVYTLSASFSTTYQWRNVNGSIATQQLNAGSTSTICAQSGTVTGGPYTTSNVACQ